MFREYTPTAVNQIHLASHLSVCNNIRRGYIIFYDKTEFELLSPCSSHLLMSTLALIGAALMIALLNVLGGIIPIQITGDLRLAYMLVSLLVGVYVYWSLEQ